MRRSQDFTDAVRRGVRRGTRTVVVHLHEPTSAVDEPALVGLVVSKAVGNAVERNQVKRRIRGLMATRVTELGAGEKLVIRALASAQNAASETLAGDVDSAMSGARKHLRRRVSPS